MSDFLRDFRRLTSSFFEDAPAVQSQPSSYMGGQADLTPLRNKAREAIDALTDAQKASDQGRRDDCLESFRRAKAAIDAALGGQPVGGIMSPVSPARP